MKCQVHPNMDIILANPSKMFTYIAVKYENTLYGKQSQYMVKKSLGSGIETKFLDFTLTAYSESVLLGMEVNTLSLFREEDISYRKLTDMLIELVDHYNQFTLVPTTYVISLNELTLNKLKEDKIKMLIDGINQSIKSEHTLVFISQ